MFLCLEANKGSHVGSAWLSKARLTRADLDNETRLLPLEALHAAIGAFLEELPSSLDVAIPYLVAQDNLAVWVHVLRGTCAPEQAFARLDALDAFDAWGYENEPTTRWETTQSGPGFWKGRVVIAHDPALEQDGLLAYERAMHLSVVPMLFGLPRGTVTMHAFEDNVQEFEVRWAYPHPLQGVAVGSVAGVVVGAATLVGAHSTFGLLAALAGPLVVGGIGLMWSHRRIVNVEANAQAMRMAALERSLVVRERRLDDGDVEGTVVAGQYRIGAQMGSGASGVIYEAVRITDGMPVAIKLLRAAAAHDVVASDRLRREAEALGLSRHPNVVEVIDHGSLTDGTAYLVMELLRGESLAKRLADKGRLSPTELYPIAVELAYALVAIHAAGVVHRDLNPSNIYLAHDDVDGWQKVKILDFGIARVEWEEMRITNTGAPLGTPGYMSPEQQRGADVDARSDIFAVGALLYECLVGELPPSSPDAMWMSSKRPHSGTGIRAFADRRNVSGADRDGRDGPMARSPWHADSGVRAASRWHASADDARPTTTAETMGTAETEEIPARWRMIVEQALAKNPDDRWKDARTLLTAIRGVEANARSASEASSIYHTRT